MIYGLICLFSFVFAILLRLVINMEIAKYRQSKGEKLESVFLKHLPNPAEMWREKKRRDRQIIALSQAVKLLLEEKENKS